MFNLNYITFKHNIALVNSFFRYIKVLVLLFQVIQICLVICVNIFITHEFLNNNIKRLVLFEIIFNYAVSRY